MAAGDDGAGVPYLVKVEVTPRAGIRDPEGAAVERALAALGHPDAHQVHIGKLITLRLRAPDAAAAERRADELCRVLLANPVIEDYRIEVRAAEGSGP
jgi:phosphoribosylformylglycinamidine synthase